MQNHCSTENRSEKLKFLVSIQLKLKYVLLNNIIVTNNLGLDYQFALKTFYFSKIYFKLFMAKAKWRRQSFMACCVTFMLLVKLSLESLNKEIKYHY